MAKKESGNWPHKMKREKYFSISVDGKNGDMILCEKCGTFKACEKEVPLCSYEKGSRFDAGRGLN